MFPPKKSPAGPPPQGPPQMGPPPGMSPGMPPMPPGLPPGFPPPGQGGDPMAAMMGQMGPGMLDPGMGQPPPPSFPAGPDGMPFGGSMPGGMPGDDQDQDDLSGSPLLQSLMSSMSSDPYGVAPGEPDHALDGGTGDPNMGLDQLLQILAMGRMGVGGGPQPGGSGVPMDPGSAGMMGGY